MAMNVNIPRRAYGDSHLTEKQKGHSQKIKGIRSSRKGKAKHINYGDRDAKRHCCTPVTNNDEPQNINDAGSDTYAHIDATHIRPQNSHLWQVLPNTVSRESDADSSLDSDQENGNYDNMSGTTDIRTKSFSSCQLYNDRERMQINGDRSNYKIDFTFEQEPILHLNTLRIRSETTRNLLQQSEPEFSGNKKIEDISEHSPSEAQLHKDISEHSPSEAQLHKDISEHSPSEAQLHKDISEHSPSEAQLHKDISEHSPSEAQLHKDISEHSPSEAQLHKDISEHSPSEAQLHKDISEHSLSEAQLHKDISEHSPSEAQLHKDSSGSQMTESCVHQDPLSYRNCIAFALDSCFLIFAPIINSDTNMSTEPPTTLYLDDYPCEANLHGSVMNPLNKSLPGHGDCKYLQTSDGFNHKCNCTWLKFNDAAIRAAAEAAAINGMLPLETYSFYLVPESKRLAWEFWRLSSFASLTDLAVSAIRLAQSGFYYDKTSDDIVCFSCGVRKRVWIKGEKPSLKHLDISPNCAHANFKDKSNIPITENNYTLLPSTSNGKSSVSDYTQNVEFATGNGKDHPSSNQTPSDKNDDAVNVEFNGIGHVGWSHETSASVNSSFQESILEKKDSRPNSNLGFQPLLVPPLPRSQGDASNKGDNAATCATKDATTKHVDSCRQNATTIDQGASQESFVPVDGHLHVPVQQQQNQEAGGSLDSAGPQSASVANVMPVSDTSSAVSEVYVPNLDISRAASRTHASIKARLASYIGWPRHSKQNPNELAKAGFYYLGAGDSVRCFYCGITVRNWRSHDDPWVVHVLFRFSCEYMIGVKGQLFITQIQIKGTQGLRSAHTTSPISTNNESTNGSMETIATQSASNDEVGEIAQAGNGASDHYNYTGNGVITNNRVGEQLTNPHFANTRIPDVKLSTAGVVGQTFHSGMTSGNQNINGTTVQANQAVLNCQNGPHGSSNHQALIVSPVTVQYASIINTTRIDGAANGSSSTSSQLQVDGNETNSGEQPETGVTTTRSTTDHHSNSAVLERRLSTEAIPSPSNLASPNADSGQTRLDRVLEANRRLKAQRTCKICRHELVDTIFLPCGHLCTCSQCASTRRLCCLCNEPIQGTAHVYLE